jgi:hypothetical protein
MAEYCTQCGAELLAGMRFCRFCGTPTGTLSAEETETQQFPSRPPTQQRAPSATRPVYLSPEPPVLYTEAPLEPPRKRRWPWVVGFVLGFLLLIGGAAGWGLYRLAHTPGVEIQETDEGLIITKDGKRIATIGISRDEETSSQEGDVITREIPLAAGGTFALSTDLGDVEISTWDQDVISVHAKRHGGSSRERAQLDLVVDASAPNNVMIRTERPADGRAHLDYEIKVPRQVNLEIATEQGHIEIAGVQGRVSVETRSDHIKVKDVEGDVAAATVSGDIELEGIVGNANTQTVSGDTKARLAPGAELKDMTFQSVSGEVDLQFDEAFNANLDISTTSGDLDVRGDMQVIEEERPGHKTVHGRVGQGGERTLRIRTVSGDIKLAR